eukprot:gene7564-7067_t
MRCLLFWSSVAPVSAGWDVISPTKSCEQNDEGIHRSGYQENVPTLSGCEALCAQPACVAVDYYRNTNWCNFYSTACTKPLEGDDGASSYRF